MFFSAPVNASPSSIETSYLRSLPLLFALLLLDLPLPKPKSPKSPKTSSKISENEEEKSKLPKPPCPPPWKAAWPN